MYIHSTLTNPDIIDLYTLVSCLLGDSAKAFTPELIETTVSATASEVINYCNLPDSSYLSLTGLDYTVARITVIRLNQTGSEGLNSISAGGLTESYITELPPDIQTMLKKNRRIRVL